MKNIPKEIYLQIDADGETPEDFSELHEVTWCKDKINKNDIKYVLAISSPDNTAEDVMLAFEDDDCVSKKHLKKMEDNTARTAEGILEAYKECFELFIPTEKWDDATAFLSTYGSGLAKDLLNKNR